MIEYSGTDAGSVPSEQTGDCETTVTLRLGEVVFNGEKAHEMYMSDDGYLYIPTNGCSSHRDGDS